MKQMQFFAVVIIAIMVVCSPFSCENSKKYVKREIRTIGAGFPDYRKSTSWVGIYYGTIPCADCPGILTELTLNYDMTYQMKRTYQEHEGSFVDSGKFTWNKFGTQIDLQNINEYGSFEHFLVQDGKLILLNIAGAIIEGTDINNYTLTKTTDDCLVGKQWKLVEIMGQPIKLSENTTEVYLLFEADSSVKGNLGCNLFFCNYILSKTSQIRFFNLVKTLKICIDMSIEEKLLQVLEIADNYMLQNGYLILNRAKIAPLAKFSLESL